VLSVVRVISSMSASGIGFGCTFAVRVGCATVILCTKWIINVRAARTFPFSRYLSRVETICHQRIRERTEAHRVKRNVLVQLQQTNLPTFPQTDAHCRAFRRPRSGNEPRRTIPLHSRVSGGRFNPMRCSKPLYNNSAT
jgi:hypothetical protein